MKRNSIIVHPILMGLYIVIALAANNVDQISIEDPLRSLFVVLFLSVLLWAVYYLIFRNLRLSALLCTLTLFLVFSYGHVYQLLEGQELWDLDIGRHRYIAPIWLLLYVGGVWLILRLKKHLEIITKYLNIFFLIVIVFPIVTIANYNIQQVKTDERQSNILEDELFENVQKPDTENLPDIYYIVLDEYTRGDLLKNVYDHDNEPFFEELEDIGFYVARCSQSNYPRTRLSMGSSLNLNYVDKLGFELDENEKDMSWLGVLIEQSRTRKILEELGYSFVAFEVGVPWADLTSADIFFEPPGSSDSSVSELPGLNEFEHILINSTIAILISDGVTVLPWISEKGLDAVNQEHRERILFVLDELERVPILPSPKFVHVHLLSPHFPVVFGPNGESVPTQPKSYQAQLDGYRDQVVYLNSRLIPILEKILDESDPSPIIILQGDHGPRRVVSPPREDTRLKILNALLLPEDARGEAYSTMTPVNTFRIVLNSIIGTDLPLLEDVSYWSTRQEPFKFTIVDDNCGD
ncbi:MAG: hypothetical protein ACERKX_06615 [Anaerolineales bacterium]